MSNDKWLRLTLSIDGWHSTHGRALRRTLLSPVGTDPTEPPRKRGLHASTTKSCTDCQTVQTATGQDSRQAEPPTLTLRSFTGGLQNKVVSRTTENVPP